MASLLKIRDRKVIRTTAGSIQSLIYSTAVQSSASSKEDAPGSTVQSTTVTREEPSIPMVPKKRDPDAVLKALASTVEPVEVPLYMRGRNIADPLYPRGRGYHMDYVQHMEAGRAAAKSIIQRWPKLFPSKPTDPSPVKENLVGKPLLERLIIERKASKAWRVYLTMRRQGKKISLSVENDLLALMAYEGLGNPLVSSGTSSDVFIDWPKGRTSTQTAESSQTKDKSTEQVVERSTEGGQVESTATETAGDTQQDTNEPCVRGWSATNIPEVMFSKMKERDGQTYEALIQGLVKFNRYGRAFDMFQEMRDRGFQASLGTYNLLLSAVKSYHVFNIARSLVKHMTSEPVVQPDITTMNHLLRIASKLGMATKTVSLQIMREIFHLGLEPTLSTFVNLLIGLSSDRYGMTNQERTEVLEQVVQYVETNKHLLTLKEETDMVFFLQAFTIAEKIGSADLALRLKALADVNHSFLIDNLNLVMSKYLATVAGNASLETAMIEYYKLVPKTFVPLEWLYREMFQMCDKHKSAETALILWQHTQRFSVPLYKVETWNSFCGALCHYIPQEDVQSYLTALDQVGAKFKESKRKPSDILLTAMVRAHLLDNNVDEAWKTYNRLQTPSFQALVPLLKKHNSLGDKKKTVEILEEMVRQKMYLPLRFAKDILWSTGLEEDTRRRLLEGLTSNKIDDVDYQIMEDLALESSETRSQTQNKVDS